MGCFVELSGDITDGDTDRVRPLIEAMHASDGYQYAEDQYSQTKGRVCLNSGGGSLLEGVKLASYFAANGVGTAVARGNSCLSACAVAFMGGTTSYENDTGYQADRVLHPSARLGFHSPKLSVSAGQYDEIAVNKAYVIALKSVATLLEISPQIRFANSLTTRMLATPADDMYILSTVGEAARWRIAIAPIKEPKALTHDGMLWSCRHVDAADLDYGDRGIAYGDGKVSRDADGTWSGVMFDGFRQEGATGCEMSFTPLKPNQRPRSVPSGWATITGSYVHTWTYQTYAAATPITDLILPDDSRAVLRGPQDQRRTRQFSGRCIVFKGTTITDNDPCNLARVQQRDTEKRSRTIDTFIWPSGAKTVVETNDGPQSTKRVQLNGADTVAEIWSDAGKAQRAVVERYAAQNGNSSPLVVCWPNPATGNRFCYLDSVASHRTEFFEGIDE